MVPKEWDGGLGGWKSFKEDMERYVLMKRKKIKEEMDKVKEEKDEVMTMATDEDMEGNGIMILLKSKAGGEAKKILEGVIGDRGYEGWKRLRWHCDRKLAAEIRFSSMGRKRAASNERTKEHTDRV